MQKRSSKKLSRLFKFVKIYDRMQIVFVSSLSSDKPTSYRKIKTLQQFKQNVKTWNSYTYT